MNTAAASSAVRQSLQLPGYDPFRDAGDCWYDADEADRRVAFFAECLSFTSGEWAGKPFVLADWQEPIVRNLFGWRRADGARRYRTLLLFVPRKNGKTELAAGILASVFFQDEEPGVAEPRYQVYSAAKDREQAKLVFDPLRVMIENEPALSDRCRIYKTFASITRQDTQTVFRVLSGEKKGKHGLNCHAYTMDELHEQQDDGVIEALDTSMGAQREPLRLYMTTADYVGPSVCNEEVGYAKKVRDGLYDPSYLPVIYEAPSVTDDEGKTTYADWTLPETWQAANPGYPVSPKQDDLVELCRKAKENPRLENSFKRLRLNIQTEQSERWLSVEQWDLCAAEPDTTGECHIGLDLASVEDIAAAAVYWPSTHSVIWRFWVPESATTGGGRMAPQYARWVADGYLWATPGNVIDHAFIRSEVLALCGQYTVDSIGYDPWNSEQMAIELSNDEGLSVHKYSQGYAAMNEPSKRLEQYVVAGDLRHGGDPVARWMASNAAVKRDPSDNIRPVKQNEESGMKIDGIIALVMAIGRAIVSESGASVYDDPEHEIMVL